MREHIRQETGLRLSDEKNKGSVPVRVVEGFPDAVARLIDAYQDRTLWRLILTLPKLDGVVDGLGSLVSDWDEFERWLELPPPARGSGAALQKAMEVAQALQSLGATKKVFDELKRIEEDILGVYRCGGAEGPHIEVFWMAHALFAGALGVRIEDLTVVTLAHELSHAYTHIGRDIDGTTWREPGFAESAREVVEGLAQFYTAVVTEKLGARAPARFPPTRNCWLTSPAFIAPTNAGSNTSPTGEARRSALPCSGPASKAGCQEPNGRLSWRKPGGICGLRHNGWLPLAAPPVCW